MKIHLLPMLIVVGTTVSGWAQNLEDAARKERARRARIGLFGKIYTNEDLRKYRSEGQSTSSRAETSKPNATLLAQTQASSTVNEERLWSKRFIQAKARLQEAEKRHEMLQARLNQLNSALLLNGCQDCGWSNGYDPYYTIRTKQQIENNQKELGASEQALEDLHEQLRKSGNPPSWESSQLALEPTVEDKIAAVPKVKDQPYWREQLLLLDKRYNALIDPLEAELFELVHHRPAREGESISTTGDLGFWFPPYVYDINGRIKRLKQERQQEKGALVEKALREGALPGWFR